MSVSADEQPSTISYGAVATSVALFLFLIMLASLGGRWSAKFPPLPDFAAYRQVADMKAAFIAYLTPIVDYHNHRILSDRKRLQTMHDTLKRGQTLSRTEARWVRRLADRYRVKWQAEDLLAVTDQLMARVDVVPVQLAVVQAAKESSWGRSRYAREVNNLFGEWCYQQGCGIVPLERTKGARHEIRRFRSASDSTRSYLHNLNSHHNYASLRELRRNLRAKGHAVKGSDLVDGLLFYSERRQQYVDEIRSMIKQYSYFLRQQEKSRRLIKGA